MYTSSCRARYAAVAPREGAWIEMSRLAGFVVWTNVAPREGAWIEIVLCCS